MSSGTCQLRRRRREKFFGLGDVFNVKVPDQPVALPHREHFGAASTSDFRLELWDLMSLHQCLTFAKV